MVYYSTVRATVQKFMLCLTLLLTARFPSPAETVRDRAIRHFGSISWAANPDMLQVVPLVPVSVPGGNEVFPALTPTGDSGMPAVYPQIEGIGTIDYEGIDHELLSFFQALARSLKDKKIDDASCVPDRAFLSRITMYRLERIPKPENVFFSRPTDNPDGSQTSTFSLMCKKGADRRPVRIEVIAKKMTVSWQANDIRLDGESYAAVAQQD